MRKTSEFHATKGRDNGKVFKLEELSADAAEWWAIKCFLAIGNSGLDVPDELASQGMAGLVAFGVQALFKLKQEDAKPLLDEMMQCVKLKSSGNIVRELVSDDIEEVMTRFELRKAVIDLHTGFFSNDDQSTTAPERKAPSNSSTTLIPRKQ